ncbi:Hpt domain-containing protein [Raoultibacter phocaeensis]|uniref:Hpt domain-containing protein n=1 Tax=Raoultibacter phocaeensis TaxID=2479841 RepID=UPI0015D65971|nr:Hpt domain-containing protein [Raoultibacter phocaeensis]
MLDETQIDDLIAHGVDYRGGVERFGGNAAMFEKFIFRYLDDDHYELLVQAIEAGDAEEGFRVAHTLKGVVGNLSFASYFELLEPLTEALRAGDIDAARPLMPSVAKAHEDVTAALERTRS